jgi:hypothetical protein
MTRRRFLHKESVRAARQVEQPGLVEIISTLGRNEQRAIINSHDCLRPLGETAMSSLTEIHGIRQRKGRVRQPLHKDGLDELHEEIKGKGHPYRLGEEIRLLMGKESFSIGGIGTPARVPNQEYLYRLSPVKKAAKYSSVWTSSSPRAEDQPPVIFGHWNDAFKKSKGQWLRLGDYAQGHFASPRGFTFWTSFELQPDGVVDNTYHMSTGHAHRLGLPNDWLDDHSVILRCRVKRVGEMAHVPTVLDGFDSEIFYPTRAANNPPSGITIELNFPGPLKDSKEEFALRKIDVREIEMLPVIVDTDVEPYINSDSPVLWNLLAKYY